MSPARQEPLSEASAQALELASMLGLIAGLAASDLGRGRARALTPATSAAELERRQSRYEEAALLLVDGRLVPPFEVALESLVERIADRREEISGRDLLDLARLLECGREAAARAKSPETETPELAELADRLPDLEPLERSIRRRLDRRGRVRDDASPELGRLRRQIGKLRGGLYDELSRIVAERRDDLAEETIPMRGGRLVVMVEAGARRRMPGLVHGRSASRKSVYFEPLEVVETNDQLQQSVEDESEERSRLLAELVGEAQEAQEEIEQFVEWLGRLDLLQAAHHFARLADAHCAQIGPPGALSLLAARHPLLDPRLAELRHATLDHAGHTGTIVPLDLEMGEGRRVLVVTGPNAGGKTVALKTLGLLTLAHQCGLPIPAAPGSRLPVFSCWVATVGDEQDLLADRSTFSGRLLRLKEAWEAAGSDSLILLDELGSGTDPEEGAALAVALVEGLIASETLALVTTHLTQVAAVALEREGAGCAAMELDSVTGRPAYRLLPGAPGGSEALALARRLGLAEEWLERAESLLGGEHRELRRLLREVERTRAELVSRDAESERQRSLLEAEVAAVAAEKAELVDERRKVGARLAKELEAFRREVRDELSTEAERIRSELEAGRRKGLATAAVGRLFEHAPDLPQPQEVEEPIAVGGWVRHRSLGWTGQLESLDSRRARVVASGKTLTCKPAELAPAPAKGSRRPVTLVTADLSAEAPSELNLIGRRVEPALGELDSYLDQALVASLDEVRVIHGHGSGRLRQAVRSHLRSHPAVARLRAGDDREGGNGATVVRLRGR